MYEVSLEASSHQILKILHHKGGFPRIFRARFCKVHAALASRLSMSRIIATSMSASLVCTIRS
jgi:hypothetical protein